MDGLRRWILNSVYGVVVVAKRDGGGTRLMDALMGFLEETAAPDARAA